MYSWCIAGVAGVLYGVFTVCFYVDHYEITGHGNMLSTIMLACSRLLSLGLDSLPMKISSTKLWSSYLRAGHQRYGFYVSWRRKTPFYCIYI